jgi:hypothetical protein
MAEGFGRDELTDVMWLGEHVKEDLLLMQIVSRKPWIRSVNGCLISVWWWLFRGYPRQEKGWIFHAILELHLVDTRQNSFIIVWYLTFKSSFFSRKGFFGPQKDFMGTWMGFRCVLCVTPINPSPHDLVTNCLLIRVKSLAFLCRTRSRFPSRVLQQKSMKLICDSRHHT